MLQRQCDLIILVCILYKKYLKTQEKTIWRFELNDAFFEETMLHDLERRATSATTF